MTNVNGEEITEELFLKKGNEKLIEISNYLDETDLSYDKIERIMIMYSEYAMIMYHYGAFMEKQRHEHKETLTKEDLRNEFSPYQLDWMQTNVNNTQVFPKGYVEFLENKILNEE